MKKVRVIIFSSALHDGVSVMGARSGLAEGLRKRTELEIIYPTMLPSLPSSLGRYIDGVSQSRTLPNPDGDVLTVCFIATGGTEEIFRSYLSSLPRPVVLLSDGFHNSFAASLEISTYLEQQGVERYVFNAPLDYDDEFFDSFVSALQNICCGAEVQGHPASASGGGEALPAFSRQHLKALEKTRIGLVGGASSWLISSDIDREYISKTYGATFVDVEIDELEKFYGMSGLSNPDVGRLVSQMSRYLSPERSEEDLVDAVRMYMALRKIVVKYNLNALTIKCFGILESCSTTSCLALAMLNDEGVVSACEGDIPALWTMLYARQVLGKPSFMANPSSSNSAELTIDFAHCTIPLSMVHGYRLPSHFESRIGIGVAGSVPSGRYRILKFSGERLDRFYSAEGEIIMNTNVPQRCRTQVRFKFGRSEDFDRFLSESKGNHIIMVAL